MEIEENVRALAWKQRLAEILFVTLGITVVLEQLLLTIGLQKVLEEAFDEQSLAFQNLSAFWETVLLRQVSFPSFIIAASSIFAALSLFISFGHGLVFVLSKEIAQVLRRRLANSALNGSMDQPSYEAIMRHNFNIKIIEKYVFETRFEVIENTAILVGVLIVGFTISYVLTFILLAILIALFAFDVGGNSLSMEHLRNKMSNFEKQIDDLMVDIVGMKNIVVVNGCIGKELNHLDRIEDQTRGLVMAGGVRMAVIKFVCLFLLFQTLPLLLIFTFYSKPDANGILELFAFILLTSRGSAAYTVITLTENERQEYHAAVRDLGKILDTTGLKFIFGQKTHDREDDSSPAFFTHLKNVSDDVVFALEDISVSYEDSDGRETTVMEHISMEVAQGERVAIIGETGCGKSTLLKLILGLKAAALGRVLFQGQCSRELNGEALKEWQQKFTLVSQDAPMFKRSILENIAYGREDIPQEELDKAIERACLNQWITSLPEGVNTVLTEREKSLSGGQRQRIQLCRAFLQKKPIVLMDEPTSNLDPRTVGFVCDHFPSFFRDKTVLIVTHDYTILDHFNRVLRLDNGLQEVDNIAQ